MTWVRFFPEILALPAGGAVVSIGNFDGVHAGHRSLLQLARQDAARRGLPMLVLTFEPHPRSVLQPHVPLHRLTDLETKVKLLGEAEAEGVAVFPFTQETASWSPEKFVQDVLVDWLNAKAVCVGENFNFGYKAAGNATLMQTMGLFDVHVATLLRDEEGEVISSRRMRAILPS
jgi:riboflavin kinase/FMN adenylyltransferase